MSEAISKLKWVKPNLRSDHLSVKSFDSLSFDNSRSSNTRVIKDANVYIYYGRNIIV